MVTKRGDEGPKVVCELIEPILRSKYPAITPEEQAVSIPLKLLCLVSFDATLVHLLNAKKSWQSIKRTLNSALVTKNVGEQLRSYLKNVQMST